jgi:hypothetical protein
MLAKFTARVLSSDGRDGAALVQLQSSPPFSAPESGGRDYFFFFFFFFFGFAVFSTVTVTVLIVLPPELTVTTVLSLPNLESSARPVELRVRVSVFFVPADSVVLPLATTTVLLVVRAFRFVVAVTAVIFRPLRCSLTVAFRVISAHANSPAGQDRATVIFS